MTRFSISRPEWLTLFVTFAIAPSARCQDQATSRPAVRGDSTCVIYALKELGDDPNLGAWIAQTIPQVIRPGTWNAKDSDCKISYFAPGKVLVVYHTAAVHAEVTSFLLGLRKALPPAKEVAAKNPESRVVPAVFNPPTSAPVLAAMPNYPVPPPLQHPKHLFHMIIRAEGINDLGTNVLVKEATGQGTDEEDAKDTTKAEASKAPRVNPVVTFILRYEGEGIIDNTVADVLKEIYAPKKGAKTDDDGSSPTTPIGSVLGAAIGAYSNSTRPQEAQPYAGPPAALPSPRRMEPAQETSGTTPNVIPTRFETPSTAPFRYSDPVPTAPSPSPLPGTSASPR